MRTVCPKCRYLRKAGDTARPDECPACGVIYAKALAAQEAPRAPVDSARPSKGLPWGKILLLLAIAIGAWQGHKISQERRGERVERASPATTDGMAQLAATVKPGDVTMYTTTECPYCRDAKNWLNRNGFAFTECDAQVRPECASQLNALGGVGVPFLVVRGTPMKNGFDSDEFLAILQR
ncbi:glutaredoxin family protein [Crenobacter cavernae]|uniref:Glutaredoxin family protein n=1 Tax=Crenobacter cavernae TaxID=2290923 RepID=A0ABY0FCF9_9NEIS|nr:glutaredoxin family protein [Crenobacter cavernae]RXZ43801.1 glutaredoxin family protein [Crenobacter cavernae]